MKTKYTIFAKPGAKKEKIEKVNETAFKIWINAPAKNNQANEKLVKMLAEHFKIAPGQIKIISGFKNKIKTIVINN
ncbi:MAG: DUF167 domain-containing protein [Patescibacteria group bacterium]